MSDKYLSIITNFGCHYSCPYCIVKNNNINVPKTTIEGLDNLLYEFHKHDRNILSISGGGDPLFHYEEHIDWYRKLFNLCRNYTTIKSNGMGFKDGIGSIGYSNRYMSIPIEMHTSYLTDQSTFPFYDCYRVVYHCHKYDDMAHVKRTGDEIIRVVFVITDDMTLEDLMRISMYVKNSNDIDELSFRQRVDKNYITNYHLHDYLKHGHKLLWWYIEQNDYNVYYAENEVFTNYQDLQKRT